MTESLLSNSTSPFKFIMTLTRGKTCGLRRRNGTIVSLRSCDGSRGEDLEDWGETSAHAR